jgi:hypothetical protein
MQVKPVVRYMVLCDDIHLAPDNDRQVTIVNLISNIRSLENPPYPLVRRELCVFLALTECRGEGVGKIVCTFEDGRRVFETRERQISFGLDPLEVVGVPFRIRDCLFSEAGLYSIQFWYEGNVLEERPLLMR